MQVVTTYAVIPAVLATFCVMFHYGFIIGTFNSLAPLMKDFYNDSYTVSKLNVEMQMISIYTSPRRVAHAE